jgi:type IV pilus assembly protein PilB
MALGRSGPATETALPSVRSTPASESLKLGLMLVQRGLLSRADLDQALQWQKKSGQGLVPILIERSLVTEVDLVSTLARQLGLEFVDLSEYSVDPAAAMLISPALSRRYLALPVGWDDGRLVVAMADPSNVFAIDDIRNITGKEVMAVVATRAGIDKAIAANNPLDSDAEGITALASETFKAEEDLADIREVTEDAPIVKLVNLLITRAVMERASDIHIEPTEHDMRVRYRVDGVLHEVMRSPKHIQSGIISRLKIMADINIAERRIPQDGRMSAVIGGKAVDLRVATLPTVYGEKVVMRILDKSTALLTLSSLGFLPESMARYEVCFKKPYGTILVTGPTGSGKSTTLYATLNILNDESKNIITVEDPVEYRLANVNQVQTNSKAGLTFASALRSILRSDPDIVLVGEIRDRETAKIAVEAALTGHLVLSTLHTNDSATTPQRLIEMGVEPFLVGSAVDCIVAQRLARRLCEKCKARYRPDRSALTAVRWEFDRDGAEPLEIFRPVGCGACAQTGYLGRFAIHEVLVVSEEIERLIVDDGHSEDIKKMAIAQGMFTLRQAGLSQVRAGWTSIEEILRVVA